MVAMMMFRHQVSMQYIPTVALSHDTHQNSDIDNFCVLVLYLVTDEPAKNYNEFVLDPATKGLRIINTKKNVALQEGNKTNRSGILR